MNFKQWGCLALAGPKRQIDEITRAIAMESGFSKVLKVYVPDDYGEFPDTSGYTREDFAELESSMEDPALYPFMTKCLDFVVEWNGKRMDKADKRGFVNTESFLHWPKFGGKVFACAGIVKAEHPFSDRSMIVVPGRSLVRKYGRA